MRSIEDRIVDGISFIVGWIIGTVVEFGRWAVLIAVIGVYLGFFLYVGWFAARGMFPDLIPWVQQILRR